MSSDEVANTATREVSFDEAVAVEPAGERRYRGAVHPSWDGPLTTHGGILAANILCAVDAEINASDELRVRTISLHYLRPPKHGEIEIAVEPLRAGRRFASAEAVIEQAGRPCVKSLLTYARRGLEEVDSWSPPPPEVIESPPREAPSVPPEEFAADPCDRWLSIPQGAPPFFQRMKVAVRFGDPLFSGAPVDPARGTENGGWVTMPDARPIDPALLAFYVDAFWPSVLQSLTTPAIAPTLDLTIHFRCELPPGGLADQPVLIHNNSIAMLDGASDSDSRVFSADGRLLAQARQLQFVAPLDPGLPAT